MTIGEQIQNLRIQKGLTQERLAEMLAAKTNSAIVKSGDTDGSDEQIVSTYYAGRKYSLSKAEIDENLGNENPWYMWCRVESLVRPIISKITGGNITKPLDYISVVNLKKSKDQAGGGEPDNSNVWSNNKRVEEYAIEDRDLLIKQIELLDPDIVICGGTYSMCMNANILGNVKSKVYDFEPKQLRSLWLHEIELASKKKNVQVIDMYHPSVPMKYDVMGELIAGAIIEQ